MSRLQNNPKYISPSGQTYTCIIYGVCVRSGWEWYGFEVVDQTEDDTIYYGFVHGFDDEFGNFSVKELKENRISICIDPDELNTLMPPVGWLKA